MKSNSTATKFDQLRDLIATHPDPLIRADATALISKIEHMFDPCPQLQNDYQIARNFLIEERRMREKVFAQNPAKLRHKLSRCDTAGVALGRLAAALNLQVPSTIKMHSKFRQEKLI